MTRLTLVLFAAILLTGCALWKTEDSALATQTLRPFEQGTHVICRDGNVRISRVMRQLFTDDFSVPNELWEPFINFEEKLEIKHDTFMGTRGLVLRKGDTKGTDTAFELTTKPFAVTPGSTFVFSISARSDTDMSFSSPHKDLYFNQIKWLDDNGEPVGNFPFAYKTDEKSPATTSVKGMIPDNARSAIIRIGADSPNIGKGAFLIYTNVTFMAVAPDSRLWPSGTFVSRPFLAPDGGEVSWEADTPGSSSVAIQISTAPDNDGTPGAWTPFAGPGWDPEKAFIKSGTPLPPFPSDHPWLKYKVTLTAYRETSPLLRSVSIGQVSDAGWSGPDMEAPVVQKTSPSLTPDPTAPISFDITDETVVDWRTISFKIDGKDLTRELTRNGAVITYTPKTPFVPKTPDFGDLHDWTVSNYNNALTLTVPDDGSNAFRITRLAGATDTAFQLTSPAVPVVANASYTFTVDVRHNLKLPTLSEPQEKNSQFRLIWTDASGSSIGKPLFGSFKNVSGWQKIKLEVSAPTGAAMLTVRIGFDNPNIYQERYLDLKSPSLVGPSGKPLSQPPNFHCLNLEVSDLSGNTSYHESFMLVGEALTRNIVTLREDGTVLIDGKPFFPIGLYAVWKKPFNNNSFDEAFQGLRKGGFNMAHTYSSLRGTDFTEFLNAADRNGIKLYIASGANANCRSAKRFLQDVVKEYTHPSILAWYLADDTASHIGAEELRILHTAIHEIDPAHITAQADGTGAPPNSRYSRYVNSTDVFMPEIYPVTEGRPGVPEVIADMEAIKCDLKAAGNPVRSIWPIIQYFDGWGWTRYPTFEELRAMSFLAIIHGGNGITWYTYGGHGKNHGVTETPETWKNICTVSRQLDALKDVFLALPCPQPEPPDIISGPVKNSLDFPSISVLLKKYAGRQYLICANSTDEWVMAELHFPDKAELVNVLFENRSFPPEGKRFTDNFAPYAVHVYELKNALE